MQSPRKEDRGEDSGAGKVMGEDSHPQGHGAYAFCCSWDSGRLIYSNLSLPLECQGATEASHEKENHTAGSDSTDRSAHQEYAGGGPGLSKVQCRPRMSVCMCWGMEGGQQSKEPVPSQGAALLDSVDCCSAGMCPWAYPVICILKRSQRPGVFGDIFRFFQMMTE